MCYTLNWKKNLTVRFLVREFCKQSDFNFNFIKQIRLRETIVYSWSESEVNFFQGQFLNSGKVFSDYDIKYLRLVRDFQFNPLQRVNLWNEKFKLCQNLDLKNNNVTDFEKPSSSMCQKRKQNISQRNRFELKKESISEVMVRKICEMSIFAFKLLERVRIWKVYIFATCHNLK